MKNNIIGTWRIDSMEMWDQEFVDLVVEGNFTFEKDGDGHFEFGAVSAGICYDIEKGEEKVHFSWQGYDEGDPRSGRGWIQVEKNRVKGMLYFHQGDHSGFTAYKK